MRIFLWIGCFSYLLIGMAHVVMGSVLEEPLQHFHRDYSDGGRLIFAQFLGFLIGVLTAPWWSRRLGRRGILLLAFGTLTVGEAIYSLLPSWNWMMTAAPVAGFGFGMVEAAIAALIMEYFQRNKAVAMSRLEVFFGIGALVMPIAGSLLITAGAWRMSFPFWRLCLLQCFSYGCLLRSDRWIRHWRCRTRNKRRRPQVPAKVPEPAESRCCCS
ncbi:MFS transporter [Paenibacillus sp. P26]|nr:MFS transporter [Paenibacillus sp. P26]